MQDRVARRLGAVTLEPSSPIVAGTVGQWTIELTVGSAGIDEGGTIKIAQRFASDFEPPQFDRPGESGYTTVRTTGPARLRPRFDRKGHDRPWMHCIVIDVYDGCLAPGDKVTVVLGDQSGGSPGIRAQSFQETAHEFRVYVDPTNACVARPVAQSPTVRIVAGPPVELICLLPTQADLDTPVGVFLKGQDRWGNPTPAPDDVQFQWHGDGQVVLVEGQLTFHSPGSGAVAASAGALNCISNPITAHAAPVPYRKFWGDLHAQSDATVGTGTEEEYFTFARDVAALDFCSHQGNDFQVRDQDWHKLNAVVRQFHRDYHFVVFPGFEWSGNTAAGGDRNVWYRQEGMPIFRSSHWQVPEVPEDDLTPAESAAELFQRLRRLPPDQVLSGAHVGGRYADLSRGFDPVIGPLVEIVSCWGVFEWMLWDAFDAGHVVGVVCNSDGHKGRPGAEGPGAGQFGIANGLTCVLAEEQTRNSIFDALRSRRCYGTSGARIDLDFTVDGQPMGSVLSAGPAHQLRAQVIGTAPLESIEVFQGRQIIHTWRPQEFSSLGSSNRLRVSWRGSRIRGRARRVAWDGTIRTTDAAILSATAHFDTPVDRITSQSRHEVAFLSQTTGDTDWIDLWLDDAKRGTISFDSKAGSCAAQLGELTGALPRKVFDFGGLDMQVTLERYPQRLSALRATLALPLHPPPGKLTPYTIKVIQTDGHMAWASPIYLRRP